MIRELSYFFFFFLEMADGIFCSKTVKILGGHLAMVFVVQSSEQMR